MKTYLGILLIVLVAIVLTVSYFMELVDNNAEQVTGLGLVIAGLVVHIIMQKKLSAQ